MSDIRYERRPGTVAGIQIGGRLVATTTARHEGETDRLVETLNAGREALRPRLKKAPMWLLLGTNLGGAAMGWGLIAAHYAAPATMLEALDGSAFAVDLVFGFAFLAVLVTGAELLGWLFKRYVPKRTRPAPFCFACDGTLDHSLECPLIWEGYEGPRA